MHLELTDEQMAFRPSVERFALETVAPRAAAIDESGEFPPDVIQAAAAQGCSASPSRRIGVAPGSTT